jgi:hypothetical protein
MVNRKPGQNPKFTECMSPDDPLFGRGIQGVDQAAHEALDTTVAQRRARNVGQHIYSASPMMDWAQHERQHEALQNASSKGNKGGATAVRRNMIVP